MLGSVCSSSRAEVFELLASLCRGCILDCSAQEAFCSPQCAEQQWRIWTARLIVPSRTILDCSAQ